MLVAVDLVIEMVENGLHRGGELHIEIEEIDRESHREKCKAYNCYVRKTGTFIRQYSDFMKPEFRFEIKDKCSYFLLTDDFINSKQMALSYVKHITDHLFNL